MISFIKSSSLAIIVLLASAQSTIASQKGLRGVPAAAEQRALQKNNKCVYDPVLHPMPTSPCPSGQAITFNRKSCAWNCIQRPATNPPAVHPSQPAIPEPEAVVYCPYPQGTVKIFNPRLNLDECVTPPIQCPLGTLMYYDQGDEFFFCVQQNRALKNNCVYDPIQNPMPTTPCPSGQSITYSNKSCSWSCIKSPVTNPPANTPSQPMIPAPEVVENCPYPTGTVKIFNPRLNLDECVTPPIQCPLGTLMYYDQGDEFFFCVAQVTNPNGCPKPKEGMCTMDYQPVVCGTFSCEYPNACNAALAGFDVASQCS